MKTTKTKRPAAPRVSVWRKPATWLGVCLAVGLAVRLAAIGYVGNRALWPDSVGYQEVAKSIRSGEGFGFEDLSRTSKMDRMPGYPVFLAAVQSLLGEDILGVQLVQTAVSLVAIWLGYVLAREVFGTTEGVATAAILAVYPYCVGFAAFILSELLFMTLMLAAAAALAVAYKRGEWTWGVVAGLAFGAATLVRASFLPVVFLAAGGWLLARRFNARAAYAAGMMVLTFALAMAPWAVRNWRASGGHLVLTTLQVGWSLYEGLSPYADGGPKMAEIHGEISYSDKPEFKAIRQEIEPIKHDTYELDRYWFRKALEFAWENPGRALQLAGVKFARFWNILPNEGGLRAPLLCVVLGVPYALVMAFALGGLARSWRRRDVALILLLPVVYYALLHMVFVGSVRYREAVMPLVAVLAAHGAEALWSRLQRGLSSAHRDRAGLQRSRDGGAAAGPGAGDAGGEASGGGG
jgi:4-amino-4-deoxy-L-arabinose transferase-like glycosyltransferase